MIFYNNMKFFQILIFAMLLTACGGGGGGSGSGGGGGNGNPPANQAPSADAGNDLNVDENTQVQVTGSGSDPENGALNFQWQQTSGPQVSLQNANQAIVSFTAPDVDADTSVTLQLTVTDPGGLQATDQVNINVRRVNQAPGIQPIANISVDEGTQVQITADATDPDGSIATYQWQQLSGMQVVLSDENTDTLSFVAPAVNDVQTLVFEIMVTDNEGATATRQAQVVVLNLNQIPTVNAGATQTVVENTPVTLTATADDPDGSIVSVNWQQTAGSQVTLANTDQLVTSFTAPDVNNDETLSFVITVTDNSGATATATTQVNVQWINMAPQADAGADQNVDELSLVMLNGSATDPDNGIASVNWQQLSGVPVGLNNANTSSASFTAPQVTSSEVLVFQFTAIDSAGLSTSDTLQITVNNVNQAPIANAGNDQTVDEGATVTLTGTASDVDGTIDSYLWTQLNGPALVLNNANMQSASFVAPDVSVNTQIQFNLQVTDNSGGKTNDQVIVTVIHVNQLPTVNAGSDITLDEGQAGQLNATASDADGNITSYLWQQMSGVTITLSDVAIANPAFTAPDVTSDQQAVFRVTVTDNENASASDEVQINVNWLRPLPEVSAGADQAVNEGETVNLAGSASIENGTISSYLWEQIAGTSVTLQSPNQASTSFVAPFVAVNDTLTFRLTATDDQGESNSDTMQVVVNSTNTAPTVDAGDDQVVAIAQFVQLTAVASDVEGTVDSYSWQQLSGSVVSLSDPAIANPVFIAPDVAVDEALLFEVMVMDNTGESAVDQVTITVSSQPLVSQFVLNDTGVVSCANNVADQIGCPVLGFPRQDAEFGRDAEALAGTLVKTGSGNGGFDFTKLDENGNALEVSATTWSCVKDNVTGLIWEVKTQGGARDRDLTYSWYNTDSDTNGGSPGEENGGQNTQAFVESTNAAGLCGASDWRMPTLEEILSIVDYSKSSPAQDSGFFNNVATGTYWSASPTGNAGAAWSMTSIDGNDLGQLKSNLSRVRLVRDAN